jgi:hypothetical protein
MRSSKNFVTTLFLFPCFMQTNTDHGIHATVALSGV